MTFTIIPITDDYREAVIDIFNYYVENSFAAYPAEKLPYQAFDTLMRMARGCPTGAVLNQDGQVVGFGMLRQYSPIPAFARTVEISYFLHPDYTGQGLGQALFDYLETAGRQAGYAVILASISSLNPGSLKFHARNGFVECGRFRNIGVKNNQVFDNIWMQKTL